MKVEIDRTVLQNVYADAHASNKGATAGLKSSNVNLGVTGTPLALSKSNVIEVITQCGQVLDEQNVPDEDRYIVFPAWACQRIKNSDLKDASIMGDAHSLLRNGRLGMVDRFTIYMSNNIGSVADGSDTCWNSIFGQKEGITFASTMTESDIMKSQKFFGFLYRGLQVFDFKAIKPEALGHLYVKAA
jgi:hypothetical protein